MDSYLFGLAVAGCTAAVGIGGAIGLFSFSFGSHRQSEHPKPVWRSANIRAGSGLVLYAVLVTVCMLVARSQSPDLDTAVGIVLTGGAVIPLLAARSGFKLLRASQREQRTGRLI